MQGGREDRFHRKSILPRRLPLCRPRRASSRPSFAGLRFNIPRRSCEYRPFFNSANAPRAPSLRGRGRLFIGPFLPKEPPRARTARVAGVSRRALNALLYDWTHGAGLRDNFCALARNFMRATKRCAGLGGVGVIWTVHLFGSGEGRFFLAGALFLCLNSEVGVFRAGECWCYFVI